MHPRFPRSGGIPAGSGCVARVRVGCLQVPQRDSGLNRTLWLEERGGVRRPRTQGGPKIPRISQLETPEVRGERGGEEEYPASTSLLHPTPGRHLRRGIIRASPTGPPPSLLSSSGVRTGRGDTASCAAPLSLPEEKEWRLERKRLVGKETSSSTSPPPQPPPPPETDVTPHRP